MKFQKIKCLDCNFIFIADSTHHSMDYCPKCKKNAVDLEEYGCRWIGHVKVVEVFNPPRFDNEDDYHSCLKTWLNESDQEFDLKKDDGTLFVIKL